MGNYMFELMNAFVLILGFAPRGFIEFATRYSIVGKQPQARQIDNLGDYVYAPCTHKKLR